MARTPRPRFSQGDLDSAKVEGIAIGREEGAAAEYERFAAILALPEAVNRQASALSLALAGPPTLSVDQVRSVLSVVPEDVKPAPAPAPAPAQTNLFEAAMERDNPELGAGDNVVSLLQPRLSAQSGSGG